MCSPCLIPYKAFGGGTQCCSPDGLPGSQLPTGPPPTSPTLPSAHSH
jgi:hypothetical protein